jgi:tryptophan synthase alpha subunit
MLSGVADGAIIGSAIVRRMQQHRPEGMAAMVSAVEEYCRSLGGGG